MAAALHLVTQSCQATEAEVILDKASELSLDFCRECGFEPLPYMRREFARYLCQGYAMDMLEEVIGRTARAPRPSFAYLSAIMRNASGYYTLDDFRAHSGSYKVVSAQCYGQRKYTEEELLSVSEDLISEARKYKGEDGQ